MKNIKSLSNQELFNEYQATRTQLLNAEIGSSKEMELDVLFNQLSKEVEERNIDLKSYKLEKQQNKLDNKEGIDMKSIKNTIKTIILTGAIAILTSIPTFASEQPSQEPTITNHYITQNNEVVTNYSDGTYYINSDVEVQSINHIDNTITIAKNDGQLYSFYDDNVNGYYLAEIINITIDQNNAIVDCTVDSEPIVYNTQIDSIEGDTTFLIANGNKYSFNNIEGQDGWITGDKCKAVIQDGRLLEVRPIPLNER